MDELVNAINSLTVVELNYKGDYRKIEPHAIGRNANTGNILLRAFQVGGESSSGKPVDWKLMDFDKCTDIVSTGENFSPRAGYSQNDKAMTGGIIAQI